jgi:hypothetical protein
MDKKSEYILDRQSTEEMKAMMPNALLSMRQSWWMAYG